MKKFVREFCSLALILAYATAMSAVFTVFSYVEEMEGHSPGLAVWLVCITLCHLGLGLFLRRERSIRAVICFCAAFFAVQVLLVFWLYGFFSSVSGILVAIVMWLYSYYNCFELNIKTLTAEKLTKGFDICSFVLILLLFFCSVKGLPLIIVMPHTVATAACLFALIVIRGGEQRKMRSLLMSGTVVIVFAAVAAVFVALASGGIKKVLSFLAAAAKAVLSFIFRMINAFFYFLARLLPQREYEMEAPDVPESALGNIQEPTFELMDPQLFMIIILGIGLLAALVLFINKLVRGKERIAFSGAGGEKGLRRSRTGILAAIKRAFSRLWEKLRFELNALYKRNTTPGLFLQIEKRSRPKLHSRDKSESCREFLCRAREIYPWAEAELMLLADAMDRLCFGGGEGLSPAEIIKMRRKIFNTQRD